MTTMLPDTYEPPYAMRTHGRLSVRGPHWNHAKKCRPSHAQATFLQQELKRRYGVHSSNGLYIRWRVRACSVCSGFYVSRELRKVKPRAEPPPTET